MLSVSSSYSVTSPLVMPFLSLWKSKGFKKISTLGLGGIKERFFGGVVLVNYRLCGIIFVIIRVTGVHI